METFQAMATQPIAITPDEALSPTAFWSSLELPFPVLVDADNAVATLFGAVSAETRKPRRLTSVIDRGGLVLLHQTTCPTQDALLAVLQGAEQGISLP